jgi:hypothetical protein
LIRLSALSAGTFSTSIQDLYADVSMSLPYLGFSRVSSSPIVMTSKELGVQMAPREQQTPEALRAFQKAEADRWWPIIKAANITAE